MSEKNDIPSDVDSRTSSHTPASHEVPQKSELT